METKRKQVVFIGGMTGAGKTTLCQQLSQDSGWVVIKQVHEIARIGRHYGMNHWHEALKHFERFINEAIDHVIEQFLQSSSNVLLFDTHYCMRAEQALRLGCRKGERAFIQDLDSRWVWKLNDYFRLKFVLINVTPVIAFRRIQERLEDQLGAQDSLEGLEEEARAEERFYEEIIQFFGVSKSNYWRMDNHGSFDRAIKRFRDIVISR